MRTSSTRTACSALNLPNGMANIHTADEEIAVGDLHAMVDVTLALIEGARAAWREYSSARRSSRSSGGAREDRRRQGDQARRVPRRAHAGRGARARRARPRGGGRSAAPASARAFPDEAYARGRRDDSRASTRCGTSPSMVLKVKEPLPPEYATHPRRPDPLHLPAPGAGARADAGADRLRRHLHRLRDGRDRRPPPAAARADERGRRPPRAADGRPRAGEARTAGAASCSAACRACRRPRWSCSAAASWATTPPDRGRHAGRRLDPRQLRRPHARARSDARRPRDHRHVQHAAGRGGRSATPTS